MSKTKVSKSFRLLWLTLTVLLWLFVAYLASHKSEHPVVWGRYSGTYLALVIVVAIIALVMTAAHSEKPIAALYSFRWNAFLLGFSTLLGLFVLEASVRIGDPMGVSYYEDMWRYHTDKLPDPDLVFRHRPSWRETYGDTEVHTNEHGLRDHPIDRKSESEFRILVLGDSVTFGVGVGQDQTFCSVLERHLTDEEGRTVRVINAGVGGYNTVQELAYLKKAGLSLEPNLVILVFVMNDIELNEGPFNPMSGVSLSDQSPPQVVRHLLWRSWAYRLAVHTYRYGRLSRSVQKNSALAIETRGYHNSMSSLGEMAEICGQAGIPLVVFFFRWEDSELARRLLKDVRQAVGAPVQDIGEWFRGRDVWKYSSSKVDSHPNAEGHRFMAEHMAEYLRGRRFLATKIAAN